MDLAEQEILKEAIDVLKDKKRPELIVSTLYGQYEWTKEELIYNDAEHKYFSRISEPKTKTVRSAKAFAKLIKEELTRRENDNGERATVSLNLLGGYFVADDNLGRGYANFDRLNSQQWNLVKNGINKRYDHKNFLLFVQALKPSIVDFQEVYRRLATLRMVGNTTITSNPMFTEDGQNSGYTCHYRLEDGCDGEETYPSGFTVTVPFAKGGDTAYEIPIDLLFYRDEDDEIGIEVLCPEFENVEEQAILDEAEYISSELHQAERLLILSDF